MSIPTCTPQGHRFDIIIDSWFYPLFIVYRYMDILKKRTDIPRVIELSRNDFRLVILPGEDKEETTNIGRPIGAEYWDVQEKLRWENDDIQSL